MLFRSDRHRALEEILAAYQEEQAALLRSGRQALQERLARDHGIAGSAVVPNPRKEPACREKLADTQQAARAKIEALARDARSSG